MDSLLQHGIANFRSGNTAEARKTFISYIKKNPQSERGWKWMYNVSRTDKEGIYCLRQILRINPSNQKAKQLIGQLLDSTRIQKNNISILIFGTVAVFLILVLCGMLAIVSTQLAGYDNYVGSNCFFFSSNRRRLCFSPQMVTQAISYPAFVVNASDSTGIPVFPVMPTIVFTSTVAFTPSVTLTPTFTSTPTPTATSTPDTRLTASFWRQWPIVPEFSAYAREILSEAVKNPYLDPRAFSKVGDCQMTAGTFLAGYANDKYSMPDGMDQTVEWFSESMLADNLTAVNGYGINTVLDPAFALSAGYIQCFPNEAPLDCELRARRPIIIMIGMGTNWIPHGEVSFEKYLRKIVDKALSTGALPILATKADNVEGDWKLNQVIAQVAYDYDLPLVNVWRSVQDLPNQGLEKPPRQVYLTGDGWMKRNYAWLVTLDKAHKIIMESINEINSDIAE